MDPAAVPADISGRKAGSGQKGKRTFVLPRRAVAREAVIRTRATPSMRMTDSQHPPASRGTILVVERDPHIRVLETLFLTEAGYALEFVDDGASALEHARLHRPDVLITEIMVPRLDGLSLCRLLKKDPETKSIMVLIFSVLTASVRARDAGADAFLRKPLANQKLVETVERLIAGRGDSADAAGGDTSEGGSRREEAAGGDDALGGESVRQSTVGGESGRESTARGDSLREDTTRADTSGGGGA